MAYSFTEKKRIRKSFAKRDNVLPVPYLLATLADVQPNPAVRNALRKNHALRFVLEKPKKEPIDAAWQNPDRCRLVCVFADSGKPVRTVEPVALGAPRIEAARTDTAWISPGLLAVLRECCLSHADSPCGCGSGGNSGSGGDSKSGA